MSRTIQIQFVSKSANGNAREDISYIGGIDPAGAKWRLSEPDAIAGIESGDWRFYVRIDGHAVWLNIARNPDGKKYLNAETLAAIPDPLLSLPAFPG